jgi:hypothetical protein
MTPKSTGKEASNNQSFGTKHVTHLKIDFLPKDHLTSPTPLGSMSHLLSIFESQLGSNPIKRLILFPKAFKTSSCQNTKGIPGKISQTFCKETDVA